MTAITTARAAGTPAAAYRIDHTRGENRGDVSMQWFRRSPDERFNTLTDLHAFKLDTWRRSFEGFAATKDIEVFAPERITTRDDAHKLFIGTKVREAGADRTRVMEASPTHWSFAQLCYQAGSAPTAWLRNQPSVNVAPALSYSLRFQNRNPEVKLFADKAELHAVNSTTYGRIPDHEVVAALIEIAGDGLGSHTWKTPGKIDWQRGMYDPENIGPKDDHTFYGSDRDMFVFLVDDRNPIEVGKLKDGSPDYVFRGFYVQNSEVGSRSLKLAAFYLRGVCMNRMLWGVEGFEELRIVHSESAPSRWLRQAVPALKSYANHSTAKLLDGVAQAKAQEVAEDDDAALAFLQARRYSRAAARDILDVHMAEEDRPVRTAWDAAQALTAYARNKPNTDERITIELDAGRILNSVTKTKNQTDD